LNYGRDPVDPNAVEFVQPGVVYGQAPVHASGSRQCCCGPNTGRWVVDCCQVPSEVAPLRNCSTSLATLGSAVEARRLVRVDPSCTPRPPTQWYPNMVSSSIS